MAERDEAMHYLLNKLKSEDGWSGSNLAWNEDKLALISGQFSSFDSSAKVKVLLSFIGMTPRTITQCSKEMHQILRLSRRDGDEWVRLLSSVLGPFPHSQTISVNQITEGSSMEGVAEDIKEALSRQSQQLFIPHEFAYLNKSVLDGSYGYSAPDSHKHFVLKKRPQASVQLRNEMLQRAGTDFSQIGSLVKDRHLLQRQMSSSGGVATNNPFVPATRTSSTRKSVPIPGMSNRIQRERGTKLLNIDEVPIATRRKRKIISEEGGGHGAKKHARTPSKSEPETPTPLTQPATPQFLPTPDYAAGLGSEYAPPMLQSPMFGGTSTSQATGLTSPTYEGQGSLSQSQPSMSTPHTPATPLTPSLMTPSIDKPAELPSFSNLIPSTPSPLLQTPPTPGGSLTNLPAAIGSTGANQQQQQATPTTPPIPGPPTGQAAQPSTPGANVKQPSKGLRLSRQQFAVAQEMFKESPSLTREQKALILGFMAGSRDNPNPSQSVVTIKLNERRTVEEGQVPLDDGSGGTRTARRNVLIETVFEMNYTTGQWRKLQLKRTFPFMT